MVQGRQERWEGEQQTKGAEGQKSRNAECRRREGQKGSMVEGQKGGRAKNRSVARLLRWVEGWMG